MDISVHGAINMLGLAKRVKAKILQASTGEVYGQWAGMGLGLFLERYRAPPGPRSHAGWA
jgi:GDP-D-mannose dehydratase